MRSARHCTSDAGAATGTISEDELDLKTNTDANFILDGKFYPLKAFVTEEVYLGRLPKYLCDALWENKTDQLVGGELIKPEIKKNAEFVFAGTIWCILHLNNILLFDFFSHLKCPDFSVKVEIFVISALSSSFY